MEKKTIILISLLLIIAITSINSVMASENNNSLDNSDILNVNEDTLNINEDKVSFNENIIENNEEEISASQLSINSESSDLETEKYIEESSINEHIEENIGEKEIADEPMEEKIGEMADENTGDSPKLEASNSETKLGSTIIVKKQQDSETQMGNPTIQNAINSAKDGDTIILEGSLYTHCHIIVNKTLTIKSKSGTLMTPCPGNSEGSDAYGIFYLNSQASGTIIQGFTLNSNANKNENDYGILIRGANNVQIINCTVNSNTGSAITIENAKNTKISNSTIKKSVNGIKIINSNKTSIVNNNIINNSIAGVYIGPNNNDTRIQDNNITYNKKSGVNMSSASYVYVLNNFIGYNKNVNVDDETAGVYINCNLTRVEIKGNYIRENGRNGILNDYRVKNLAYDSKSAKLESIEGNYFIGHTFRVIYHINYRNYGTGDYIYNATTDLYTFVGEGNGIYRKEQGINYFGYNFFYTGESFCPSTYYNYVDYTNNKGWTSDDSYRLVLSDIKQLAKGTYSISIIDKNGNVAKDLSSLYVTFYLNKNNTLTAPQEGDIYKTVLIKNGTATASFEYFNFMESGNLITAVFPNEESEYTHEMLTYRTFKVADSQIPHESIATKITISNLNTYPNSGVYLTASLKDSKGHPLPNKTIKFALNGNTYTKTTDAKGQAKIQIKLASAKTYTMTVSFAGYEEYNKSSAKSTIVVKKINQKIICSNKAFAPKSGDYYIITLRDSSNKAIAGKKITVKIGTKTYTKTTDKKGQVKIKINLSKKKTYKVTIKSKASTKYNAITKTSKITIKQLKQKISSSNKVFAPNSVNYYTIKLKDQNNRAIAKKKIIIKIGQKTYKKKTDKNGAVKLKIKLSKKKTYKVTIVSPKTSQYNAKTKTNKITIKALTQKIISSNKKYLPQAGEYYIITLKDQNKQLIKNKKVKFTLNKKTYTVKTNKKGVAKIKISLTKEGTYTLKISSPKTSQYKAVVKTNKITIQKGTPSLISYDRTYANGTNGEYSIYLKDYAGKALANGKITCNLNSKTYSATTNSNGVAKFTINLKDAKSYPISIKFLGNIKNKAISKTNTITIKEAENTVFVDKNLPNSEIQKIIDNGAEGYTVEFLGTSYSNINLNINKGLNILSNVGTTLSGNGDNPVLKINSDNVKISNLNIIANSKSKASNGILINNAKNINVINNSITNALDSSKMSGYNNGSTSLPGYGIAIKNSANVNITGNTVNKFESALYNEYSQNLSIKENKFTLSNYGIKYGFGSANTEIINNTITDNIGWYVMDVPEGPCGYGIYLNNSAVNITISQNNISNNYMGISIDANNSTGIVIVSNLISENAAEGIRFNAGYDLAQNAIEPVVTNNAIYRNAKGPTLMTLGEMSANPFGIYGVGYDEGTDTVHEDLQLHIGSNWYGANSFTRWNINTGNVGIGTMCPRIKTTEICFDAVETESPGTYKINFFNTVSNEPAMELATFDLYATLNNGTEKQSEVHFLVINGTGTFSFDKNSYLTEDNKIIITVLPLSDESFRTKYSLRFIYEVPNSEIPV